VVGTRTPRRVVSLPLVQGRFSRPAGAVAGATAVGVGVGVAVAVGLFSSLSYHSFSSCSEPGARFVGVRVGVLSAGFFTYSATSAFSLMAAYRCTFDVEH
jgi:hypothetical protein